MGSCFSLLGCLMMDTIHKEMLAAAFYCSCPSPLPLWFKMILLNLLNSIKLSSCYDLYIWLVCYLRHINYPDYNLTYATYFIGSP